VSDASPSLFPWLSVASKPINALLWRPLNEVGREESDFRRLSG
jgi:hypothetical protein